ncbi:MAG: TetR/AcrR family transcriptional regulator [Polyangiaceae bacterium]
MPRQALIRPRKLPTQARALETVEAILAATKKVIVKEGYEGTTTNRVAEVAGVSIGSLYQYFPSKESLLAELVDRHLKKMLHVLSTTAAEGQASTLEEAARTIIHAVFAAHRVSPKLHRVVMQQMARLGTIENIDAFEVQTEQLVVDFLTSHHSEVRPKNVKLAARVALLAVRGTTLWTVLRKPEQLEDEEFQTELVDMVIRYLVKGS